ncbi:hypothetical protein [Patiriisocius marinus]|uniref:hypothetical protein n=1 Tax=Patiriisocius marinus TaxID=1397112 RepID=UPI0023309066|nr:hypothetical protein [Patiriisocius marinus]
MTLEIIVFVLAILFGMILYWSESKSNRVYRWINHLTHNEDIQMKADNRKGFFHLQPFIWRLVYLTLLFVVVGAVVSFATPINAFYIQYFVSAIVGTLIGTYLAGLIVFASEKTKKEALVEAYEKGKESVEDLVEDVKDRFEPEVIETKQPSQKNISEAPKKSARDRFKDKGMIK